MTSVCPWYLHKLLFLTFVHKADQKSLRAPVHLIKARDQKFTVHQSFLHQTSSIHHATFRYCNCRIFHNHSSCIVVLNGVVPDGKPLTNIIISPLFQLKKEPCNSPAQYIHRRSKVWALCELMIRHSLTKSGECRVMTVFGLSETYSFFAFSVTSLLKLQSSFFRFSSP